MPLQVIGAGLGRTATFSMKFALEHLGLGPCYHMSEVFAGVQQHVPLWLDAVQGKPDWDATFDEFQSTMDYPACTYWRMQGVILDAFDGQVNDRAFMTQWFRRRNQQVIDAQPPERLLVFAPKEGWKPLCRFLGVPVPSAPFPRVNSRDELGQASDKQGGLPPDPATAEKFAREYIDQLKAKAFDAARIK